MAGHHLGRLFFMLTVTLACLSFQALGSCANHVRFVDLQRNGNQSSVVDRRSQRAYLVDARELSASAEPVTLAAILAGVLLLEPSPTIAQALDNLIVRDNTPGDGGPFDGRNEVVPTGNGAD